MSRNRIVLTVFAGALLPWATACSSDPADATTAVAPPAATAGSAVTEPSSAGFEEDPAVTAVHAYLRQQALAVNAGTTDAARAPGFTATLTPAAQAWAVPLLLANLGDWMPGPYPVGVLGSARVADDRVDIALCLQDRGWQVERSTGRTLNAAHYATARAVVVRAGERWLVDDVVADGGACTATDVVQERF